MGHGVWTGSSGPGSGVLGGTPGSLRERLNAAQLLGDFVKSGGKIAVCKRKCYFPFDVLHK